MGIWTTLFNTTIDVIKLNDKVTFLSDEFKELSSDVRDLERRLIRIETVLEIAQIQKRLRNNVEV